MNSSIPHSSAAPFKSTRHVVVMGVSGCGKSTVGQALARVLGITFADADDFHPANNVAKMALGIPLSTEDRLPWLATLSDWLDECSSRGNSTVLACSALQISYRDALRRAQDPPVFVHLEIGRDDVVTRVSGRTDHYMPVSLVNSQFDALQPLTPEEDGLTISALLPIDDLVQHILSWLSVRT